jgi:hypothetical protein
MSWFSKGLEKLGISKGAQQALTKPLLIGAAPFTGGSSLLALPFVNTPGNGGAVAPPPVTDPTNPLVQSILAMAGILNPPRPAPATPPPPPPSFWRANKVPILIGSVGLVAVGGLLYVER